MEQCITIRFIAVEVLRYRRQFLKHTFTTLNLSKAHNRHTAAVYGSSYSELLMSQ